MATSSLFALIPTTSRMSPARSGWLETKRGTAFRPPLKVGVTAPGSAGRFRFLGGWRGRRGHLAQEGFLASDSAELKVELANEYLALFGEGSKPCGNLGGGHGVPSLSGDEPVRAETCE